MKATTPQIAFLCRARCSPIRVLCAFYISLSLSLYIKFVYKAIKEDFFYSSSSILRLATEEIWEEQYETSMGKRTQKSTSRKKHN